MILSENLKKKKFVVTAEIQPPIGADAGDLVQNVKRIRGRVDALTVPELKIEGLVADTMRTCRILKEQKFDPILQTPCRDRNRVELQEYLLKASEAGIENILTFTEDYRITGDSLQEMMFFHVDAGRNLGLPKLYLSMHESQAALLQICTNWGWAGSLKWNAQRRYNQSHDSGGSHLSTSALR